MTTGLRDAEPTDVERLRSFGGPTDALRQGVPCALAVAGRARFLTPRLDAPNVDLSHAGDGHWGLLGSVLAELTYPNGNLCFDIRTVVLMREHGIRRIYATDTDFLQFTDIEVVTPLRA